MIEMEEATEEAEIIGVMIDVAPIARKIKVEVAAKATVGVEAGVIRKKENQEREASHLLEVHDHFVHKKHNHNYNNKIQFDYI